MITSLLRLVCFLTIFCFIACSANSQYIREIKRKNFITDSSKKKIKLEEKSPLLAGGLSFFLPGLSLGQIYNEDYEKFALHFGISASILAFAIIGNQTHLYELGLGAVGGGPGKEGKNDWIFTLCVLAYTGNWLWSTIDAIHSATMYNRKLEQRRNKGMSLAPFKTGFVFDKNGKLKFLLRMDL